MRRRTFSILTLLACVPAIAGEADVIDVKATLEAADTFGFDVTVSHADAGWEHYADRWEVIGADGAIYGTRVLAHPHDDEQPFTRSQGGIKIPEGVRQVTVRAHDLVHEFGGREMTVALPGR